MPAVNHRGRIEMIGDERYDRVSGDILLFEPDRNPRVMDRLPPGEPRRQSSAVTDMRDCALARIQSGARNHLNLE
jgi:hypothetical protein